MATVCLQQSPWWRTCRGGGVGAGALYSGPPPPQQQTEIITFPQLRWRAVIWIFRTLGALKCMTVLKFLQSKGGSGDWCFCFRSVFVGSWSQENYYYFCTRWSFQRNKWVHCHWSVCFRFCKYSNLQGATQFMKIQFVHNAFDVYTCTGWA